jgi:hypothetical protein
MELSLQNRIRQRAHELAADGWMAKAEQHWLAAERDVLEQMSAQVPVGTTRVSTPRQRRLGTNKNKCTAAANESLSKKAATAETLTI